MSEPVTAEQVGLAEMSAARLAALVAAIKREQAARSEFANMGDAYWRATRSAQRERRTKR
jgi:hypothetical protein